MWTNSYPPRVSLSSTALSALEPISSPTTLFFFLPSMCVPWVGARPVDDFGQAMEQGPTRRRKSHQRGSVNLGTKRELRDLFMRGGAPKGSNNPEAGISLYKLSNTG